MTDITPFLPDSAARDADGQTTVGGLRLSEVALRRGDWLAIPVAGAYHLSMASNYNLAPRPTALWVEDGQVSILQIREALLETGWWA